jgi:hypothetical protein
MKETDPFRFADYDRRGRVVASYSREVVWRGILSEYIRILEGDEAQKSSGTHPILGV